MHRSPAGHIHATSGSTPPSMTDSILIKSQLAKYLQILNKGSFARPGFSSRTRRRTPERSVLSSQPCPALPCPAVAHLAHLPCLCRAP